MKLRCAALGLLLCLCAFNAWAGVTLIEIYVDSDNNVATGCTVATSSGSFSGVDHIIRATVDSDGANPPYLAGASLLTCPIPGLGEFSTPLPGNSGTISPGSGVAGFNPVEINVGDALGRIAPSQTLRFGVATGDGQGDYFALLTTTPTSGRPILLAAPAAPAAPVVPAPVGGIALALLVCVGVVLGARRRLRRHDAWLGMMLVCAGLVAQTLGFQFDWSATAPLAQASVTDPTNGSDVRAFFAQFTASGSLALRVDVAMPAPPTLTAVTPDSGSQFGGNIVTLTGTHFGGTVTVSFGGRTSDEVTVVDDHTVTAQVPSSNDPGPVDVSVTTPNGSATLPGGYTYTLPPTSLDSLTPDNGAIAGGTVVQILGLHLDGASAVTFDGIPGSNLTLLNSGQATVIAPPHAAGFVDVTLIATAGSSTLSQGFRYIGPPKLTSLSPTVGRVIGGDGVFLSGTQLTGTTQVAFGGAPATDVTAVDDNNVVVNTPAHAVGLVDVVLVNASGSTTLAQAYRYAQSPGLNAITPSVGPLTGGQIVTVTGTELASTTSVTFDGVSTAFTVVDNNTVTAITPAHASGSVDVVLTTAISSTSFGNGYLYEEPPTINAVDAIAPNYGDVAGGTGLNIYGTNLIGTTAVTFDGVAATLVYVEANRLRLNTPPHASGPVDVTVTTPAGSVTRTRGFTYAGVPTLSSVSPNSGAVGGSTMVTLHGTSLSTTIAAVFDGVEATSLTVVDDTTLTAITPAHANGIVDVYLVTPFGPATLANAFNYTGTLTLTGISPSTGSTTGGTLVTLTGSAFTPAMTVSFGGMSATSVTLVNATTLTAIVPAYVSGPLAVDVQVSDGVTNSTLPAAYTYVP